MSASPFFIKLSLFSALLFISILLSPAHAAKRICTRSHSDSCPQDFKNMCAFFSNSNCDSGICQRLTHNECTACLDPNVLYYFDQPCPGDKIYCDAALRPTECPVEDVATPVCAFTQGNCTGELCRKTASSGCQACQDSSVVYYQKEDCPALEEEFECNTFDFANANCTDAESRPVCAYFTEQCDKEICSTTVYTSCAACLDPFVLYYKEGECEQEPDQRKYCLPGSRPEECIFNSEPVCGFSSEGCEGGMCGRTYQNDCNACQDNMVSYYTLGECVILAKKGNEVNLSGRDIARAFQQENCDNCENGEDLIPLVLEEEAFEGETKDLVNLGKD